MMIIKLEKITHVCSNHYVSLRIMVNPAIGPSFFNTVPLYLDGEMFDIAPDRDGKTEPSHGSRVLGRLGFA